MGRRVSFLLFILSAGAAAADHVWTGVERIVAVGDVHGDYHQFVTVLHAAGVVDDRGDWIGGATHLVQTGDVPDRGPDTRKALELLQKLEKQAARAGGMVHALIGNHEAMNVYGDLRYVTPEDFAAFQTVHGKDDDASARDWIGQRPAGYFERGLAFARDGELGRWIASHDAVIRINDMLFLHGGLSPKYATTPIEELNRAIQLPLQGKARLAGSVLVDDEGPLWYRGMAQEDERREAANVGKALETHGVKRIVIGHTFTEGTVMPRFGGKVILIDVGLASYYGGRQACLLVEGGKLFTLHRGKRLRLPLDDGEGLLQYLETAAALDPAPSPLLPKIEALRERLAAAR